MSTVNLHCWEDGPDERSTCMLPAGHEGPHEFKADDEIRVEFTEESSGDQK